MKHKFAYQFIVLLFICANAFAQDYQSFYSNRRVKKIPSKNISIQIDTVSVIPNSFYIKDISKDYYHFDPVNAFLTWKITPVADSVEIIYRTFSVKLNNRINHVKFDDIRENFLFTQPTRSQQSNNPFIDFGTLQTSGSIGRSIVFGNNQDASVNSTMNLQLTGYLSDSLELTAVLNDNNVPIQPEGNTQSLSDFDKIYLELKKRTWKLQLGDIDIQQQKLAYLQFSKRLQGITFTTNNQIGKNLLNQATFCGAISKGKYTKNLIKPIEGNQGPYKLQGANNELYFIVLAGTEKVYIDGELMQRGQDEDYIMDYNTSEISFTTKRVITKDLRIQIEFEYADRNYLNTQLYFNDELSFKNKLFINVGVYANYDDKNATIDQKLDDNQKMLLANVGDSIQNAFITNAQMDTFSVGKLLYKKIDTVLLNNNRYSIFLQSNSSNDSLYNVSFSFVGAGKGNYVQKINAINGKLFEWVSPGYNNEKNGDWEPVSFIPTPKKLQVYSVAAKYQINKLASIHSEFALSDYDKNLFSSKDKSDNQGFAGKCTFFQNSPSIHLFKSAHQIETKFSYEHVAKSFQPVERLRNIEFYRDWNLAYTESPANENTMIAMAKLHGEKDGFIKYELTRYNRDVDFSGIRHEVSQKSTHNNWVVTSSLNWSSIKSAYNNGDFIRPSIDINKTFKKLKNIIIGFHYNAENNKQRINYSSLLSYQSFAFDNVDFFIKSDAAKPNKIGLQYNARVNYLPFQDQLIKSDNSQNYTISAELMSNENHQLKLNAGYRRLQILQKELLNQKDDQSIVGRVEYNVNVWDGLISGNLLYESGGGQEQKKEYSYVAVPAGQGLYQWNDYNGNGIEELNEFELAAFQDQKKYIRIYTPTNQYIKTNFMQFNYGLEIKPEALLSNRLSGISHLLRNTSLLSVLQFNKNEIARNNLIANPLKGNPGDSELVSMNAYFSNTFFYNRNNPKWGFEATHSQTHLKSILTYGLEEKTLVNLLGKIRVSITRQLVANLTYKNNSNHLNTSGTFFSNKNYRINDNIFEPNVTYVYKNNVRLAVSYVFSDKRNTIDSMESAVSQSFIGEIKYNLFSNTSLNAKYTLNKTVFHSNQSNTNNTIGYVLLNGLAPGQNSLWSVDFTQRLHSNIEINIQYEGRKPGDGPTINIGRASVRAIF